MNRSALDALRQAGSEDSSALSAVGLTRVCARALLNVGDTVLFFFIFRGHNKLMILLFMTTILHKKILSNYRFRDFIALAIHCTQNILTRNPVVSAL